MDRRDLQHLSRLRARESRLLFRSGSYQGAYYLMGYAVECALKACIARQFGRHEFPDKKIVDDSYTHSLEKLLSVSGLRRQLETESGANPNLAANWNVVKDWSEISRYRYSIGRQDAQGLYSACTARRHGILTWIRRRW